MFPPPPPPPGWLTVSTKSSTAVFVPSVARTVIVEAPNCPVAGVTVNVRGPAVPCRLRAAGVLGTSVGFEEVAVTTRAVAGVSGSDTVNAIGAGSVPSRIVWF